MLERFAERGDGYFAHTGLIYDGRFDPPHAAFGDRKLAYYAYQRMVEALRESDWDRVQTLRDGSDGVFCVRCVMEWGPLRSTQHRSTSSSEDR
jgi:hypothetical protein